MTHWLSYSFAYFPVKSDLLTVTDVTREKKRKSEREMAE